MNRERNIKRFEELMEQVDRPGKDALMGYIWNSDFYTAPASTKFHLSCEGGLLQHSLNVYDALLGHAAMAYPPDEVDYEDILYTVAYKTVIRIHKETAVIVALLHDICKTNFYGTEMRNQKIYKPNGSKRDNGGRFDWEQVPFYTVNDKNPYGHGEKSVMMIEEFMKLSMEERYAIRWHMGMSEVQNINTFNQACEKYPLVLLLHMADQEASHFMEDQMDNKEEYQDKEETCCQDSDPSDTGFQEAEPIG